MIHAASQIKALPELLTALEQRLSSELFQISENDLKEAYKKFHRAKVDKEEGSLLKVQVDLFITPNSVSKADLLELHTFAPYFLEFINTIFVKFTVVLSTLKLVSDEISKLDGNGGSLMNDSMKIVRQEVRNVLGTFLKGSKLQLVSATFGTFSTEAPTKSTSTPVIYVLSLIPV